MSSPESPAPGDIPARRVSSRHAYSTAFGDRGVGISFQIRRQVARTGRSRRPRRFYSGPGLPRSPLREEQAIANLLGEAAHVGLLTEERPVDARDLDDLDVDALDVPPAEIGIVGAGEAHSGRPEERDRSVVGLWHE